LFQKYLLTVGVPGEFVDNTTQNASQGRFRLRFAEIDSRLFEVIVLSAGSIPQGRLLLSAITKSARSSMLDAAWRSEHYVARAPEFWRAARCCLRMGKARNVAQGSPSRWKPPLP
jgi:hypothetical protein